MRQWFALVAAVALVVAGCSSSVTSDGGGGARTSGPPAPAPGGRPGATTRSGGANGTVLSSPQGGVVTTSQAGAGGPAPVAPPAGRSRDPYDARGGPGSYARTLLGPSPAGRLALDLLAQQGAAPPAALVDHVHTVLAQVSHKPVSVLGPGSVPGGARSWTPPELAAAADDHAGAEQGGGRAVVHLLFVHGTLGGDDSVLGAAVRADLAAVFVDRVAAAGTVLVSPEMVEDSVTMHEAGHLLGLVDLVLHTGRQDPDHPGHSRNPQSVMYWAVESDLVTQVLNGPPPRDFDQADLRDLATIRSTS